MLQISERFFTARDCEFNRYRTSSQAPNLRKNKPHPVAHFFACLEFREDALVDWLLRLGKTLQMKSVGGLFGAMGMHSICSDKVPERRAAQIISCERSNSCEKK